MGNESRSNYGVIVCNMQVNICDPEVAGVLCLKCWGLIFDIMQLSEEIIQ